MKTILGFLQGVLLIGLSTSNNMKDTIAITEDFFPEALTVYSGQHDIVKLLVPLKYDRKSENDGQNGTNSLTVFFVEADIDEDGNRNHRGLYVLKHGIATKLLDQGTDIASSNDRSKQVLFGARDGLYKYNENKNKAEKYGLVNDSIIGLTREYGNDVIYIISEDRCVYKVTDQGKVKTKVDAIVKADQIIVDFSNNLYFYNVHKEPYVYDGTVVRKIEGLPEDPYYVNLINPSYAIDDGIPFIVNNQTFIIYANGTSENVDFEFKVMPTAYAMEATVIQYYAYDKKIYEYNLIDVYVNNIINDFRKSLENRHDMLSFIKKVARSFPDHSRKTRSVEFYYDDQ